jgi:hypothetical protein
MEALSMRPGDRAGMDDAPTRGGDQDDRAPMLLSDEPVQRPEQSGSAGVVDAWFFLGW